MTERYVAAATTKRDAIRAIYAAVQAPRWAAPNLDGLLDILRDLSWLPPGPVVLRWPAEDPPPKAVADVLAIAVEDTAGTHRPVTLRR